MRRFTRGTLNFNGFVTPPLRPVRADTALTSCFVRLFMLAHKRALFSTGQKRSRDARTYFRMNRQILTLREVFVGLPSGRKLLLCAQCLLLSEKRVQLRVSEKSRFAIWSWRRDLNPRPSDYKSDALPAELRQHKPPVTGHKVNKLAQRQSACNTSTHCLVRGNVTCVVPLLYYFNKISPFATIAAPKKIASSILIAVCSSIANC